MVSLKVFKCLWHVECLGSTELCNFRAIVKLLSNLLKAIAHTHTHTLWVARAVTGATIVFLVNGTTKRRVSNASTVGNFTGEVLKRSLYLFYSISSAFALLRYPFYTHLARSNEKITYTLCVANKQHDSQPTKKMKRFCCCCCCCYFYYCHSHSHC